MENRTTWRSYLFTEVWFQNLKKNAMYMGFLFVTMEQQSTLIRETGQS